MRCSEFRLQAAFAPAVSRLKAGLKTPENIFEIASGIKTGESLCDAKRKFRL